MKRSSDKTSVNIATFKAQMAKYLRLVKSGEEIVILDHKLPVATVVPFDTVLSRPLDSIKPKADFSGLAKMKAPSPGKKPKEDSLALLLAERASR